MITNDRQYRISKKQAEKFHEAIRRFDEPEAIKQGLDPLLAKAHREGLVSELDILERDLRQFEDLKNRALKELEADSLAEVGVRLIEARLSQRLTQKKLAAKTGLQEQQIQRYEAESYKTARPERLDQVAKALGLSLKITLTLDNDGEGTAGRPDMADMPGAGSRGRRRRAASPER